MRSKERPRITIAEAVAQIKAEKGFGGNQLRPEPPVGGWNVVGKKGVIKRDGVAKGPGGKKGRRPAGVAVGGTLSNGLRPP